MGYTIIGLSGVCDIGSENHLQMTGHMTSGESFDPRFSWVFEGVLTL